MPVLYNDSIGSNHVTIERSSDYTVCLKQKQPANYVEITKKKKKHTHTQDLLGFEQIAMGKTY